MDCYFIWDLMDVYTNLEDVVEKNGLLRYLLMTKSSHSVGWCAWVIQSTHLPCLAVCPDIPKINYLTTQPGMQQVTTKYCLWALYFLYKRTVSNKDRQSSFRLLMSSICCFFSFFLSFSCFGLFISIVSTYNYFPSQ